MNSDGVRADIIMDSQSPYKRSIIGVHHEIYINASLDRTVKTVREWLAVDSSPAGYMKAYEYFMGFYKICSPVQYQLMTENQIDIKQHVDMMVNGEASVYLPADNPVDYMKVVEMLEQHYPACLGPVSYINDKGKQVVTKNPILIGGTYLILLDKITTDTTAVASANTQHFGVPSRLNKTNKHHSPTRSQPTKAIAEDESRLATAVVGGRIAADILDQTSNPDVHKTILAKIYDTYTPSSIESLVDREVQPMGKGHIQNMVNNVLFCAGIKFEPTGVDDD